MQLQNRIAAVIAHRSRAVWPSALLENVIVFKDEEQNPQDSLDGAFGSLHVDAAGTETMLHAMRLASLGAVSAGIIHELCNIQAPILGLLDMALAAGHVPSAENRHLQLARDSLARANILLRRLLRFARHREAEKEAIALPSIVDSAIALSQRTLANAGVEVVRSVGPSVTVRVDEILLTQVVVNLLLNARDAVADSSEKIVRVSYGQSGSRASITVEDSGIGMSEEIQDRIFEPFFSTKRDDAVAESGTGLGLSVSKTIMELHGGGIDVSSVSGAGSIFTVWFPVDQ